MLTLREIQSGKQHNVTADGVTMGREGGEAEILIRNAAVSKLHARIYLKNGGWWLEDLRSANGTFVGAERLSAPVQLEVGLAFALAGVKFEVEAIEDEGGAPAEESEEEEDGAGATVKPNVPAPRPPPRSFGGAAPAPAKRPPPRAKPAPKPEPEPEPEQEQETPPPEQEEAPEQAEQSEEAGDEAQEQEAAAPAATNAAGAGAIIAKELPKAIAYYLVAVPKLLFNPMGTIRKSIEDQKVPGIKGFPLVAWAAPGLATTALMGVLGTLVASIIGLAVGGGFAIGALIGGLITTAISAVVGGLIVAFLYHPVMGFIIKLLKGESDEKSRTNYLVIGQAGAVLSAVPSALSLMLAPVALLIPIAIVGRILLLVPALLSIGTTLITLAIAYFWFQHFKVHKVVLLIIKILAVLSILGGLFNVFNVFRGGVGGGAAVVAPKIPTSGDSDEESTDAKPLGDDVKKAMEEANKHLTPEQRKALADAQKLAEQAGADVKKAMADAKKAGEAAAEAREAAEDQEPEKKPAKQAKKDPEPQEEPTPAPKKVVAAPTPAPEPQGDAGPLTPYQRFAQKRDFVEKTIAADPTLLQKDADLLDAYKELHSIQRELRKKKGHAPDDLPALRLLEAETFERTRKLVDDLHSRLQR